MRRAPIVKPGNALTWTEGGYMFRPDPRRNGRFLFSIRACHLLPRPGSHPGHAPSDASDAPAGEDS